MEIVRFALAQVRCLTSSPEQSRCYRVIKPVERESERERESLHLRKEQQQQQRARGIMEIGLALARLSSSRECLTNSLCVYREHKRVRERERCIHITSAREMEMWRRESEIAQGAAGALSLVWLCGGGREETTWLESITERLLQRGLC